MELAVVTTPDAVNPDLGDMYLAGTVEHVEGQITYHGTAVLISDLAAEVAQRLFVRFQFFRGEWFLDLREGLPYFEEIFSDNPKDEAIRAVFVRVVAGTEGVASVERLEHTVDNVTGALSLSFAARLDDGTLFDSAEWPPFIVKVA